MEETLLHYCYVPDSQRGNRDWKYGDMQGQHLANIQRIKDGADTYRVEDAFRLKGNPLGIQAACH